MRAIQNYLPNPRHTEVHRIFVNATPEDAWTVARHFDMSAVPWIKVLFDIRTFPEKLANGTKASHSEAFGVDQITESNSGFILLHESPGREVVIGSIGQFWRLKIPFLKITSQDYKDFNASGFGKVAWAISVEPFLAGSTIAIELRISATDEKSWKKLNRYYHVIGVGSNLIRTSVMAHLEMGLGKMKLPDDDHRVLSGDELIPDTKYTLSHHRNIEAPVAIVWDYLMQLGCDRAGWYSIDALDNGGRPSLDHLVDFWETRKIGDRISATPQGDNFFCVYAIEKHKHFVIGGDTEREGGPFRMTWAFILEPIGEDATHLISRARMESFPKWKEWFMGRIVYPPVHGLMSLVQLETIKKYAERDAQQREVFQMAEK